MIVIPNFVQAHHLYRQGHIPFRLLQEQAMVLIGINSGHYVDEAFDMGDSDIEWLLQQPESSEDYNGLLGGEVNVCQTEADLKEIVGMDMEFAETHGNRWRLPFLYAQKFLRGGSFLAKINAELGMFFCVRQ